MSKILALALALAIPLAGCGKSKAERQAAFLANCQPTGFTTAQCQFLFAMAEQAADDSNTALAVGIGVSSSMSAASSARR